MKYPARVYARAMLEALESASPKEHRAIMRECLRVLERTGDISRAPLIVKEIEKMFSKKYGGHHVHIELAHPAKKALYDAFIKQFSEHDHVRFSINPSLIAGSRITIDDTRELDYSLSSRLRALFTSHAV